MKIERRTGPLKRGDKKPGGQAIIYSPASPPRNAAEASAEIFAALWLSVELGKIPVTAVKDE